uniref:Proteasome subunit beta n=2 Tax=Nyssomyia neivai TaxID=330878 RepID=A0A1L8DSY5_9DIPT
MSAFGDCSMPIWSNGPAPGKFYNFPGGSSMQNRDMQFGFKGTFGTQRTSQPITTGTSVVGLKFTDGVVIAADTLVSYGSLARYTSMDRVFKVNDYTIIGAGGDFADFQFLKQHIDQKIVDDIAFGDNYHMKPKSLYNWLMRVLYNKRSRFDPLWLDIIVGGMQDGEPFLGHINLRGRAYENNAIATGYGQHLAIPLLREYSENPQVVLDRNQALGLTKKVMEVLYYRDCRSFSKYTQAVASTDGVKVEGPINVDQNWNVSKMIDGF